MSSFVWFDIKARDKSATARFYRAVTQWSTEQWDQLGYTMFVASDGRVVAGIRELAGFPETRVAAPHWFPYIAVADLDATASRALGAGGEVVVPRTKITSVGEFLVLASPQGLPMAAFVGESADDLANPGPVGHFLWGEIRGGDAGDHLTFLSAVFGWDEHRRFDFGTEGSYHLFGESGASRSLGGVAPGPGTPCWVPYIRVGNMPASLAIAQKFGGEVVREAHLTESGDLIAHCRDPEGALFALQVPKD